MEQFTRGRLGNESVITNVIFVLNYLRRYKCYLCAENVDVTMTPTWLEPMKARLEENKDREEMGAKT